MEPFRIRQCCALAFASPVAKYAISGELLDKIENADNSVYLLEGVLRELNETVKNDSK